MTHLHRNTVHALRQLEQDVVRVAGEVSYEVNIGYQPEQKASLASQALILAAIQISGAARLLEEDDNG